MSRVIEAFAQFLDNSGNPLTSGWLYFTESGTAATEKNTFSDLAESSANANPVQLDASGRAPDIFGTGTYRVVSKEHNVATGLAGSTVQTFDPVTAPITGGIDDWSAATTYSLYDLVVGSDNLYYSSLANSNLNNDPISDATKWEEIKWVKVWNTNVTYAAADLVIDSNGNLWTSIAGSNTANDPSGPDYTKWEPAVISSSGNMGGTEKTIASGTFALTSGGYYTVDTEADAASDDLDSITGIPKGHVVYLHPAHTDRTIVVKHDGASLYLTQGLDFTMDNIYDNIILLSLGSNVCIEIGRTNIGS